MTEQQAAVSNVQLRRISAGFRNPRQVQGHLTAGVLLALPFLLASCCSDAQPRFWKVRDAQGGGTTYAVDTVAVPASSIGPRSINYVNAAGDYVEVAAPQRVCEMSAREWQAVTSGASYSLRYCGIRKACWAKAKAR